MMNFEGIFTSKFSIYNTSLQVADSFKYLVALFMTKVLKLKLYLELYQTIAALSNLNSIWYDTSLHLKAKIKLMLYNVKSIFLYARDTK